MTVFDTWFAGVVGVDVSVEEAEAAFEEIYQQRLEDTPPFDVEDTFEVGLHDSECEAHFELCC